MSTTATTTARRDEDRRKSRKGIIGLAAMATAGALVVGLGFAYFSDTLNFSGSADAGTLDITNSTPVVEHTDGLTVDNFVTDGVTDNTVPNLNPGDAFTLTSTITNGGNKSAWIRSAISGVTAGADIAKDLYVYTGEDIPTQTQLLAASDSGTLADLDGYVGTAESLAGASASAPVTDTDNASVKIIAGTGTAAETESTTDAGDNTYDAQVLVYFDKDATNEDQGESVTVNVLVQAMQYRNNNEGTGFSDDAPSAPNGTWSDVVGTAFGADAPSA